MNCLQDNGNTVKSKNEDTPENTKLLSVIYFLRLICVYGWIGVMMYGTWQIFQAAEEYMFLQRNPKMYPSVLSEVLGRGRDISDKEWNMFASVFASRIGYGCIFYVIVSKLFALSNPMIRINFSTLMSIYVLYKITGLQPTLFLVSQPLLYWLMMKPRYKSVIWGYTLWMLIYSSNIFSVVITDDVDDDAFLQDQHESESQRYYFITIAAWNFLRCVSYVFDTWNRPKSETDSVGSLFSALSYCMYFPLLVSGPIILFDRYENHIYNRSANDKNSHEIPFAEQFRSFSKNILRISLLAFLLELILHYFYVRPLVSSAWTMKRVNLWVVCTSVYWIGQIFTLKYQVMYGVASVFAEFDGLPMPPLPRCPGYIHRYSVLWKDFDRGLYYFLIRYIYVPIMNSGKLLDSKKKINVEMNKFFASIVTFSYIYLWHGTHYSVFIWALFNFIGITFERIGSCIKRLIDKNWKLDPLIWDIIVEPIVTVPLASMSLLNSSIFCGSLEMATTITARLWNDVGVRDLGYIFLYIYFLTHVAVAYRTGSRFNYRIKMYEKTL